MKRQVAEAALKLVIEKILKEIGNDHIFDSHYVISQLIKFHSDEYLVYASSFDAGNNFTLTLHGQIGQLIASFESTIIDRIPEMSWSENIHGKGSECTAWKKLKKI